MKTMDRFNSGLGVSQVLARRVTAAWLVAGTALALALPARADWVAAAGGAEMSYTENGTNYHAHIFTTTGTDTLTVTQGGEVEVLVVAGGGGGGQWNAGGGGAGGLIYTSTVVDAVSYSVTVGSGGAGGVGGVANDDGRSGSNGSDSVFDAFTAIGGGGGGAYRYGPATSGGSGGGGRWNGGPETAAGTEGQGHAGGAGLSTPDPYAGAGGGGAGEDGQSANPGNGGAGLEFPQFALFGGSPAGWFAGGGGGGGNSGAGAGGSGGGGAGQNNVTPASGGTPGVANTGGGGGGGGTTGQGPGGSGGSGIVIVRYVAPPVTKWALATGGTETNFTENGINYHAHIFTATGPNTFYVIADGAVEYLVVGGGGAGRGNGGEVNSGSGGNGGQLISGIFYSVPAGVLPVTVGAGGVGVVSTNGSPGGDSAFWTITAAGGAGGAFGASSGGTYGGNGAGGAGAGRGDGPGGNAGGPGIASTILGSSVTYAGGGGGGFSHGGNGGSGGGGRGESYNTGTAESGAANTGGGGGGVSNGGATPGKNGGSGIVIIRYQRTLPTDNLINLDINGYAPAADPVDPLPWTSKCYFGAAVVGAAGDFWNSAAIEDSTFETLTAPLLKMADGLTSTTVRFSISRPGGLLHGDCREPVNSVNALLDDYVYLSHENNDSDTFTISGLAPSATYDLYIYSHAGNAATPGRFTIWGIDYDSTNDWVSTGDYAKCLGIAANGDGVITGTFSRLTGGDATFNGLQIVGTFPVSHAEIVNLDLNGFWGTPLGAGSTYSGAARVGWAGDYWNSVAVSDGTLSITAPSLKLANSITNTTTVSFSLMSKVVGGVVHGNGRPSVNAMFSDYAFITDGSSDRFTISGLVPNAAYDLYFYCHEYNLYNPGRFVINGKTYDSIDMSFPASGGGDTAICAGITADGGGQIIGEFSQAVPWLPVVVNGLQIVGAFPRRQADLVNIDLNGYGPGDDPPPGEGDTYSGAARVGADGDYWNGLAIGTETVTNITVSRLKFADGATKSRVSFTIGRVDGLLTADRIVPQVYLNSLMGDYAYYYNATGTVTIAGLYPNTAYDLYFYCGGGSLYFPVRFEINGATYDSFDRWFEGSMYSDYAVCAGIMADGSGSITGTFYKATPDSATCVSGVQIMGKIPLAPQGTIIVLH